MLGGSSPASRYPLPLDIARLKEVDDLIIYDMSSSSVLPEKSWEEVSHKITNTIRQKGVAILPMDVTSTNLVSCIWTWSMHVPRGRSILFSDALADLVPKCWIWSILVVKFAYLAR